MNKKLALKFNFIFIILVLFVSCSFIFTGVFFNNKTSHFSTVSVVQNDKVGESVSVSNDATNSDTVSEETTTASAEDSITDFDGWTESDPIVTPKEFTKIVGGYVFIIKLGTDDDVNKYQLFMLDYPDVVQLTTDFATDYGLIDGLIIDEIKRRILFFDVDSYYSIYWEYSSDTQTTIVYKTKILDYKFTLTLSIAIGENFGKINLLASDENNDNEVYLLESENGTFVGETQRSIGLAVMGWTLDENWKRLVKKFENNPILSLYAHELETNIISLVASIIGSSIGIGVIVFICWYFIRNRKQHSTTSSTIKSKKKTRTKRSKRK